MQGVERDPDSITQRWTGRGVLVLHEAKLPDALDSIRKLKKLMWKDDYKKHSGPQAELFHVLKAFRNSDI